MGAEVSAEGMHTFAICAYGQSPYLPECIRSVLSQSEPGSKVFVATSTPSDWLDDIARAFNLPVYVNRGEQGIGQDWNFAYSKAMTPYVTIAHQDDVYCPDYAWSALRMLSQSSKPIIYFSNYGELRDGRRVDENRLLHIKRVLLHPLEDRANASKESVRRRVLSFGSAICCPSVTFCRSNCPVPPFRTQMRSNLDWDTWEGFCGLEGDFVYDKGIRMYHRIHEDSTTSKLIENSVRGQEDFEMLSRFWPEPIAKVIYHFYAAAMASNQS